jgi:hypothetical protein
MNRHKKPEPLATGRSDRKRPHRFLTELPAINLRRGWRLCFNRQRSVSTYHPALAINQRKGIPALVRRCFEPRAIRLRRTIALPAKLPCANWRMPDRAWRLGGETGAREIRINQNPFSAHYEKLGYGRIEILTKPGTDKLHGNLMIMGNDSAFNSLNPFVSEEPSYYMNGSIGGALGKKVSWFGSVFSRNNASNSIINAEVLDTNLNTSNYTAAVANPQSRLDISPRLDFQLSNKNTLTVRYMFDRQKQTNSGASLFALQSQAYDVSNFESSLQISDTQVLSANAVKRDPVPIHSRAPQSDSAQHRSHHHGGGRVYWRRQQRRSNS